MLIWSGEAPLDDVAEHVAAPAGSGCLSLEPSRSSGQFTFTATGGDPARCTGTRLSLIRDAALGSNRLSSDLEFSNLDLGRMTAQEVRLKFGVGRDLLAGLHASFDASLGRVLGSLAPDADEQLHAALSRPLDAHWETGLEGHVAALGGAGLTRPTERTGLIFLRGRYNLVTRSGEEQRVEFKLSADTWQASGQSAAHHARADLRYEYRRDNNVLSIGLAAIDTAPMGGGNNPSLRLDLRATRPF